MLALSATAPLLTRLRLTALSRSSLAIRLYTPATAALSAAPWMSRFCIAHCTPSTARRAPPIRSGKTAATIIAMLPRSSGSSLRSWRSFDFMRARTLICQRPLPVRVGWRGVVLMHHACRTRVGIDAVGRILFHSTLARDLLVGCSDQITGFLDVLRRQLDLRLRLLARARRQHADDERQAQQRDRRAPDLPLHHRGIGTSRGFAVQVKFEIFMALPLPRLPLLQLMYLLMQLSIHIDSTLLSQAPNQSAWNVVP